MRPATPIPIRYDDGDDYESGFPDPTDPINIVFNDETLTPSSVAFTTMAILDENQKDISDGLYLKLANQLQLVHTREANLLACIRGRGEMLSDLEYKILEFSEMSFHLQAQVDQLTAELRRSRKDNMNTRMTKRVLQKKLKIKSIQPHFRFHMVLEQLLETVLQTQPYDMEVEGNGKTAGYGSTGPLWPPRFHSVETWGRADRPAFRSSAILFEHDLSR